MLLFLKYLDDLERDKTTPRPLIRAIVQVVKPGIGDRIYDGAVGSAGFLCESFEYLKAKPGGLTTKDVRTLQERTFFVKEMSFSFTSSTREPCGRRFTTVPRA